MPTSADNDGHFMRHALDLARGTEQYRHDVGEAQPDEREAGECDPRMRRRQRERHAERA